ncbi:MAG: response regulator [Halobacteriaceae archaeon]
MTGASPDEIRVLHVDDDAEFLDLAREVLERDFPDVSVDTVTRAEDGLDRLAETEYDCLVVDYVLPTMDGLEFLQRVREVDDDVPIIFFTGRGSEEVASEAISAGVTDYLQKGTTRDRFTLLGNRVTTLVLKQRAETAARTADRRAREVYERITVGFFALDGNERFTYVNGPAEELFGADAEDLEGENIWRVFPGLADTDFQRGVQESVEDGEHASFEAYAEPFEAWLEVYTYPDESGVSVFVDDVTDYHLTRRELESLREDLDVTREEFRVLRQKLSKPTSPFR